MAETTTFPKMPATAWRTLRLRAASAPSTRFTAANVAAMLKMANPESAAGNIVRPMKQLGIIGDDGTLTPRGNKWRVEASYPEACQEILDEVYPNDLAGLTGDDGSPDKSQVLTWLEHRGYGASNARQMAATYVMIAEKTVPDAPSADAKPEAPRSERRTRVNGRTEAAPSRAGAERTREAAPEASGSAARQPVNSGPSVHLDIQVHIPAAATPEQIDHIFGSMAKHLYGR